MPFFTQDLRNARKSLEQYRAHAASPHHERYSFPFFCGTYFSYRRIDVRRTVAIARDVGENPSYLDVGCGYGDFLKRVREFLPDAEGMEKDAGIFYGLGIEKPGYIAVSDAHWISKRYDVIFVGWMEPGQDYRDPVAKNTDVVITTLDQGLSLAAEFDGHGFERVARWRTPSWEDVNIEIMNRHYTKMGEQKRAELAKMRGAHNLWYVYARPRVAGRVREALKAHIAREDPDDRYDFEAVLDECGFGYMQKLENPAVPEPLWQVSFD
ncbi:hypothetical protein [Nitrososphaera sp.]|uniref:hypothetical protein n=1 Tax=Nitrososphaera sp. TaxID=1971748 RepID=UPI00316C361D